jgi:hypothetical protein
MPAVGVGNQVERDAAAVGLPDLERHQGTRFEPAPDDGVLAADLGHRGPAQSRSRTRDRLCHGRACGSDREHDHCREQMTSAHMDLLVRCMPSKQERVRWPRIYTTGARGRMVERCYVAALTAGAGAVAASGD